MRQETSRVRRVRSLASELLKARCSRTWAREGRRFHARPAWAGLLLLVLVGGCAAKEKAPPGNDGSCAQQQFTIRGRVVDFETCFTRAGCAPVSNVRVGVHAQPAVLSAPTPAGGSFTVSGCGDGSLYLLVKDASSMGEFLPTLQAAAVTIDEQRRDIYGLELYALRKNGIYSGIQQEANVDLGAQPLYLGVAYEIVDGENGKLMKAFNQDKHATASCSIPSTIRYVDCPTVYKDACATEKTLFDATRTMTGPFAEFVVIGSSGTDANDGTATITVVGADAAAAKYTFPSLTVPVGTGYLTVGLHLAEQH